MHWVRLLLLFTSVLLAFPVFAREELEGGEPVSREALRSTLNEHVGQARFAEAAWGIEVVSLESREVLYQHNAEKLLKPASNAKLFSGALALDRFGSDHRIRTSVYARSKPNEQGEIEGDLIVYGRGDPSMAARFRDGDYEGLLAPLAEAVAAAGVKRVRGDLVGDETYFVGAPFGSTWSWEDLQYYYGAQVSALTVQDNVIDLILRPGKAEGEPCSYELKPKTDYLEFVNWAVTGSSNSYPATSIYRPLASRKAFIKGSVPLGRSGYEESVSVPEPARWFVELLAEELEKVGVKVEGELRTRSWPIDAPTDVSHLVEITSVESAPMREMVARMMKPSQNLYAQLLLLQAGAAVARPGDTNSWTENLGLRELRKFAERAGIPDGQMLLEEGSGLSRGALVTPHAIIQLLRHMRNHPEAEAFREALPVAGVDGTLRSRLGKPGLKGNVRAKTGTIRYVNALSGYMTTRTGEELAFSILSNAYDARNRGNARAELDYIVELLWRLERGGEPGATSPSELEAAAN